MQGLIPIIVAFTPNYLVPVATTLLSILEASPSIARYEVICLVGEEPDEAFRANLARIDGGSGRLCFRYMNLEHKLKGAYVDPKYSSAANYRLVIAEELPEYTHAIYTDCDIIIRQDLSRLYREVELGDNYMAGIAEASSDYQVRTMIEGGEPGKYVNSGFLVLNLEQMRQDGISERFANFLAKAEKLEFPDQDAINIVCKGRLAYLSPVYNSIRTFLLPAYRDLFLKYYPDERLWHELSRSGNIHYTGQKPWLGYDIYFEEWWRVYWRLPGEIRREMEIPSSVEWQARLFCLPFVRRLYNSYQLKNKPQIS